MLIKSRISLAFAAFSVSAVAQMPQNPSPMVEHTRPHPRLTEQSPRGSRYPLEIGTLYVPPKLPRNRVLLVFFHGGTWLPEVAASKNRMAAISIQVGEGSSVYAQAFQDPARFRNLIGEAEDQSKMHFSKVILGGWSAGCGAIRQMLRTPEIYSRVNATICIDGMHAGYPSGKPGPMESELDPANLDIWEQLGKDAIAGKKQFIVTHSEIFPGTYASTTETADYLVQKLGVPLKAVLKQGPTGMQQLSEAKKGKFLLMGFAGTSAPDHVDQVQSLPNWLKLVK
jgi:hypothetical protein